MIIIKPSARIINPEEQTANFLTQIEYAARISHRSEEDQTAETTERFIRAVVLKHGDWSVVEHCSISVEMIADRGITHEIVRHRIASYTQESTRFVNYAKKMLPSFIYPVPEVDCHYCLTGDMSEPSIFQKPLSIHGWQHMLPGENRPRLCVYNPAWLHSISVVETMYRSLIDQKWRPQEARSVFPNALASKIMITMNLRSWRQFLLMRTTKESHPQMRQIAIPLLEEFKQRIPILFEDIIPEQRQVDNIAKGR